MGRFAALLPELILTIGGTILMMVAAFTGRRGSGLVNWLAVALLLVATVALIGAPSHAGPVFDGLVTEDLFGSGGQAGSGGVTSRIATPVSWSSGHQA